MVTKVAKGRFLLVKLAGTEDNGPRSKSGVSSFVQNLVAQGKYFWDANDFTSHLHIGWKLDINLDFEVF